MILSIVLVYNLFLKQSPRESMDPVQQLIAGKPGTIRIIILLFSNGSGIPIKCTCNGDNISHPIRIENVPDNARSLLLIIHDLDAPHGIFHHWILYNIPPSISENPENIPRTPIIDFEVRARNDFDEIGYRRPCPPDGHGYIGISSS